jgi:hypothetical protein
MRALGRVFGCPRCGIVLLLRLFLLAGAPAAIRNFARGLGFLKSGIFSSFLRDSRFRSPCRFATVTTARTLPLAAGTLVIRFTLRLWAS